MNVKRRIARLRKVDNDHAAIAEALRALKFFLSWLLASLKLLRSAAFDWLRSQTPVAGAKENGLAFANPKVLAPR